MEGIDKPYELNLEKSEAGVNRKINTCIAVLECAAVSFLFSSKMG